MMKTKKSDPFQHSHPAPPPKGFPSIPSDPNPSRWSGWLARFSPAQRLAAAFVLYLVVRGFVLGAMSPVSFIDTATYADQYRNGFAQGFFCRGRSWCYPLIFWLAGHSEQLVVAAQRLTAALAWFALALAVAGLFRTPLGRRCAFWGTLVMSLTLFSVLWDGILLSEGFSIYFLLALTAAWIFLLRSEKTSLLPLGAFVSFGILFAGMRDAGIPLLLVYSAVAAITLLLRHYFSGSPRPPRRILWGGLALIAVLLACILAQIREIGLCHRNWQSVAASLSFRVYRKLVAGPGDNQSMVDEKKIQWLAEHYQVPVADARARTGLTAYEPPPLSPQYRDWLLTTGSRAWLGYMLHHPGEIWELFNVYTLHNLTVPGMQYLEHDPPKWKSAHLGLPTLIQDAYQGGLAWLLSWEWVNTFLTAASLLLGVCWIACWPNPRLRPMARIAGVLSWWLGTAMAGLFIGVFGDFAEPWRHSILGIIALYAALPVVLAVPLETFWILKTRPQPEIKKKHRLKRHAGV